MWLQASAFNAMLPIRFRPGVLAAEQKPRLITVKAHGNALRKYSSGTCNGGSNAGIRRESSIDSSTTTVAAGNTALSNCFLTVVKPNLSFRSYPSTFGSSADLPSPKENPYVRSYESNESCIVGDDNERRDSSLRSSEVDEAAEEKRVL
uniref:Uncharacterized protein n=1 Tax=Vespula pensylvanica TaxID=30213 RepID=A0A834P1F8_VESPE|nr:hypothetical protein H0235_009123 [Vespula pensylvanica]